MTLTIDLLQETKTINLEPGKYYIADTIDTWLVKNSLDLVVAVSDKFSTTAITLEPGEQNER